MTGRNKTGTEKRWKQAQCNLIQLTEKTGALPKDNLIKKIINKTSSGGKISTKQCLKQGQFSREQLKRRQNLQGRRFRRKAVPCNQFLIEKLIQRTSNTAKKTLLSGDSLYRNHLFIDTVTKPSRFNSPVGGDSLQENQFSKETVLNQTYFLRETVLQRDNFPEGQFFRETVLQRDSSSERQFSRETVLHRDSSPERQFSREAVLQ